MNLGHQNMITTFGDYGHVTEFEQEKIIKSMSTAQDSDNLTSQQIEEIAAIINRKGVV